MRNFYLSLSKKNKRHYAAAEANRMGHGGTKYVASILGIWDTRLPGKRPDRRPRAATRDRSKKNIAPGSEVEQNLISQAETRTGGDLDRPDIRNTDLTPTRLQEELAAMGIPAGDDAIRQWMDEHNLCLRKIRKVKAGGQSPDRDSQFQIFAELIKEYQQAGNPCFSVYTMAKEFQGPIVSTRPGSLHKGLRNF